MKATFQSRVLASISAVVLALLIRAAAPAVAADKKPNIVVIMGDDIGKATPVLRTVSMVIPQARALATLKYVATGTYAFVGSAQAEGKVVDSVTGQVLAAGVDKRVGGGSIKTAAQWQLGDAENAMTAWSKQLADRLSSWTSGTAPS